MLKLKRAILTDMTEGRPAPLLLRFMIPMLIGNIFQQLYSMADTMIVGKTLGSDALAAVGATGSLNFLFFSLCNGLASGLGILVSQAFGAGQVNNVKKLIANSVYIMLSSAVVMGSLGFALSRPVLRLLGTPANIIDRSTTYMQVSCAGLIAVSMYNCVAAILRGVGDSKTPLYFLVLACVLNVFLDLFFIKSLGLGVGGAALATILSQML
ncbi:MAG: polysaccharide biosynthesis C-terminal domain-containing protein, partial [Clostridia bacterium]|nr:polysaccharide biosynthesis C-terminal domain-containing protein [Clostridia bacterium]